MRKTQSVFLIFLFCTIMIISCTILKKEKPKKIFKPSESAFFYEGRFDFKEKDAPSFSWSGTNISFRFQGSSFCKLYLKTYAPNQEDYYAIIIDNQKPFVLKTHADILLYDLAKDLDTNEHQITVFKRTESGVGTGVFLGVEMEEKAILLPWKSDKNFQMEFIGNSITCGYGNEGADQHCKFSAETENNYMAYGAITARKLNASYMATAISGYGIYRSYGEDTMQVMPRFYDKVHRDSSTVWNDLTWHPSFTIINLGTNDFFKGIPDESIFRKKYLAFIYQIKEKHPDTKIVCLSGPMMNDSWPPKTKALTKLNNYLKEIIKQANQQIGKQDVFFLGLTPQGKLGYGCSWHPNIKQHEYNAEELYAFLLPLINQ